MTNHQSSKPNKTTMHPLIIVTLLSAICFSAINCKPNNNQQQQQFKSAETYDKQQLSKKQQAAFSNNQEDFNILPSSGAQSNATSAAAANSLNFQCPEQFGYYTDVRDCTKYYVCVFGEVLHESCTGGLRFSRELQTCDWPRNVDCPQAPLNASSSAGSPNTPFPSPATTAATTAPTTTSFSPSSASTSAPGGSSSGSNRQHQHGNPQEGEERSLKGSASLVFADEGSDPQQPSFDEAVSPVITPDGTIHLHDGSGGTFSLTPNHNRADHNQQQQPQESPRPNNVDVFVKPIQLASQQQQQAGSSGQQQQARTRAQTSAGNGANQRQLGSVSKLQPATLPEPRRANPNMGQQQQRHNGGGHFSASNKNSPDHSESGGAPNGGLDSESVNNDDEPPNSSIGAQADQESYEESSGQPLSGGGGGGEQSAAAPTGRSQAELQQAGYIPPVMANGPPAQQQQSARTAQQVSPSGRQSSQLLSFNNRQLQDSRQSFKPILLSSSSQASHSASSQQHSAPVMSANNEQQQQQQQQHNLNQRSGQQGALAPFSMPIDPSSSVPFETAAPDEDDPPQEDQTVRPPSNQNLKPQQQQQSSANGRQQQQQTRQNNQMLRPQQHQHQHQARMSANTFSLVQPGLFVSSTTPTSLAGERQPHSRQTFLAAPDNQIMSNNVNFNESSKLIRLQASHFDQLPPGASMLEQAGGQQFGPASSFVVSKFPSRSQSVLFSQQPFGFAADQSREAAEHEKLGQQQAASGPTGLQQLGAGSRQAASGGDGSRLLHQQRRARPPKRQQIPSAGGGQRRPASHASHFSHQIRPDPDPTTTTTSTAATTTSSNLPPAGNSFLSPYDASFMEVEEQTEPPPPSGALLAAVTRANQPPRPIVAPTTVNFQQQDAISGLSFATMPSSTFATTPSSGARLASGSGRRFNDAVAANKLTAGNSRAGPTSGQSVNGLNGNGNNQPMLMNQGQRSAQLIAPPHSSSLSIGNEQSLAPQGNAIPTTSSMPITATTTTTTTTAASATANAANQQSADQQDPQLIANRYLNSAIDALEAGQPFGAVDYDFDILNDNSTDRRNPAGAALGNGQLNNNGGPAANANRQRQQQQQQHKPAFGGSGNVLDDEGENISLINGQPSGRTAGLSTRPAQANGGRARTAAGQSQQQVGVRQQQQQQNAVINNQQFSNQQQGDLFSAANPPSSASAASSANQQQAVNGNQQQLAATKKPRPTNRKIAVNHEQALANNRASTEPARRPEALFATPNPLQTATKCDTRHCRLPDCKCGDTLVPANLDPKVIPQIVLLTFDDAVNDLNWEIYEELFTGRTNPNGCPILATFYVSHEWTDYGQVQTLYSRGHEMASHSVTHSFGEKFSKSQWFKEVNGQREILNMYGGVKMNDVRGMRAPFLQIGGNKMFEMLYDANFTYDSSMPIFENSPPLWPYTLDYQLSHECMITPCPTKSFPGVWEVGMTMWVDLRGGRCSMGDACSNPADEDGVYEMLMKNFNRHYKSNRAPFGLFYHSAWFNTVHHRRGFLRFLANVNSLSDVFFVTNWQMLQWMRKPTPMSEINSFEPWQCPAKNDRPPPCFHPSVCNVKSEHGTRFMKTCQPCPVNQQYPWVGSTGFKGKQAAGSG